MIESMIKHANTPSRMVLLVAGTLFISAGLFSLIEGTSLLDSVYWASTTMTSVGYGDVTPATAPGKIMTIVFQLWSIFVLLPLTIWNVINLFDTSAHTHEEQEWEYASLEIIADAVGKKLPPQPKDY